MTALFGAQYFGFIASAYAITFAVLAALTAYILITHRRRRRQLADLKKAGMRRTARRNG